MLQAFPYSDTSKILRVYSAEYGLRSLIAKGAQRPRNRFGGLLEPFTEGEAEFYLREGRDLHTLGGFDLLRSRQALGRDLAAFAGASLLAEIVLRAGTEEPQPELFTRLTRALDRLADGGAEDAGDVSLAGVWAIVSLLGFEPELACCVHCGHRAADDEPTRFDVDAGGIVCLACRPMGRVIEPAVRAELRTLVGGRAAAVGPEHRAVHRALLRAFLSAHLGHERPLRSLELFTDQFR